MKEVAELREARRQPVQSHSESNVDFTYLNGDVIKS